MRRWNGWGDTHVDYPLPEDARSFLRAALGEGMTTPDARASPPVARRGTTGTGVAAGVGAGVTGRAQLANSRLITSAAVRLRQTPAWMGDWIID